MVLQGGGDKGAYQAGALSQIIEGTKNSAEVQYDVISGVSIGSINGAVLASYPKGNEKQAADYMIKTWEELTRRDVYKDWPWGGVVRGILHENALYDSSPFREYIRGQLKPPVRHFFVSATDARTGAERTWDETTPFETLLKAIDASSSYPGFFSPVDDLDNTIYYDGGVSFSINIHSAVLKCRDKGFKDEDITIDVLMCTGATFTDKDVSKYNTIPMTLRFYEIEHFYDTMELLVRGMTDYYKVNFRYVIAPTDKIESSVIPMQFSHDQMVKMIAKGKSDAKQVMKLGHRTAAEYLVEYTNLKKNHRYTEDYGVFLDKKIEEKNKINSIVE